MKPSRAQSILKRVFGYDSFRSLQEDIIENVLAKKDTLVIMPTGGGKSVCYQIPALIFEGMTVVVSPLISLMKDQVEQLHALGISAAVLNSSLSPSEYNRNFLEVRNGAMKLLYVAPETLFLQRTLDLLKQVKVDCLTIDEAHCISEWGHDFRPEYRRLAELRKEFESAVCIALTATATPKVQKDIAKTLDFEASNAFLASFNRDNLFIEVTPKQEPIAQTVRFLHQHKGQSGIIYCFSRRQVDDLSAILNGEGFSVRPYHAGMDERERRTNQELFIRDDVQIIVATIAFGMGINKSNVRFVLHFDLPKSIESYYQEIGRAGRDGLKAHCLLLFSYGDLHKLRFILEQKEGAQLVIAKRHLNAIVQYAETEMCRRRLLLRYFGETFEEKNCRMCDNCTAPAPESADITREAQMFLSCIKRTGEVFGVAHIIDVLRGAKTQKVLKFGHQRLSTYNVGSHLSKQDWNHLARQFGNRMLFEKDEVHGSLAVTETGYEVLQGERRVKGSFELKAEGAVPALHSQGYDAGLFEELRKLRKMISDAEKVPPYVIFSDKSLSEMAMYFPQTQQELGRIYGVGESKLSRYGQKFLGVIRQYCQSHGLSSGLSPVRRPTRKDGRISKHTLVGKAFNEGRRISDLAHSHGIKMSTIVSHLETYLTEGNRLLPESILVESKLHEKEQKAVLKAFVDLGPELLRPIYDRFDGKYDYDELRILRLHYLALKKEGLVE
jgi:ATP-dependent DNA helicase RecQ